jgi:hypothetical protein
MLMSTIGAAAALVLAAKVETSYLNVNEEAFLVQKSGIVSIVEDEEDLFFGLASREDGVTGLYVSDNGWMRTKTKVKSADEKYDWEFQITGGTLDVN